MLIQHRWLSDNEPIYMHHVEVILRPGKRDLSAFIHSWHLFFFGLLWKCIVVKLSLLEEKITAVPKSRPRGTSLPTACWCDAVYKEEEFTVEACCSFNLNPKLNRFQDWSYSLLRELPPLFPPLLWVNQEAGVQTPGLTTTVDTELCHGCRLAARWNSIPPHDVLPTHILQQFRVPVCLATARVASRNRILLERHRGKMLTLVNPQSASSSYSV